MEVHHHPNLHHKPKPWKEYILEYFMIFLAVMTGFFAESYREHLGERSKEREYAIHIKKDLVRDTTNLNVWIPALRMRVAKFDTLISYLKTNGTVADGGNMYFLARISTRNAIFEPSDNTIAEMKSSGNLRLIRSHDVVDGIMNIERILLQCHNLVDIEEKEDVMTYPLIGQLFDATIFNDMMTPKGKTELSEKNYAGQILNVMIKPPGNPQLLSGDRVKINELIYCLHQRKSSFLGEISMLCAIKKEDARLMEQLQQQYNLKQE